MNETNRKGKGKGHGGKGEHESKEEMGSKGAQQPAKMPRDEVDKADRVQVALDVEAGGSHPQHTLDPEEAEEEEEEEETGGAAAHG